MSNSQFYREQIVDSLSKLPRGGFKGRNRLYFLFDKNEIVYVGISKAFGVYARIRQHRKDKIFDSYLIIDAVEDRSISEMIETEFISLIKPRFNTKDKDIEKDSYLLVTGLLKEQGLIKADVDSTNIEDLHNKSSNERNIPTTEKQIAFFKKKESRKLLLIACILSCFCVLLNPLSTFLFYSLFILYFIHKTSLFKDDVNHNRKITYYKKYIHFVFGYLVYLWTSWGFGFVDHFTIIALLVCSLYASYLLTKRLEHILMIKKFKRCLEHIIIVPNSPNNKKARFSKDYKFVFTCHPDKIHKKMEELSALLIKSKNPLYLQGVIKIWPMFFQDGEFVNETWEQYQNRVESKIKKLRYYMHVSLKKRNFFDYIKYQHQVDDKKLKNLTCE